MRVATLASSRLPTLVDSQSGKKCMKFKNSRQNFSEFIDCLEWIPISISTANVYSRLTGGMSVGQLKKTPMQTILSQLSSTPILV